MVLRPLMFGHDGNFYDEGLEVVLVHVVDVVKDRLNYGTVPAAWVAWSSAASASGGGSALIVDRTVGGSTSCPYWSWCYR